MRKQSKQSLSVIQRKIWQECRRIVEKRDTNPDGTIDCYTCPAKDLQGANRQLGHMWAKAAVGANLKYSLEILKYQCFRCNIHLGGQGAVFYARRIVEIGPERMKALEDSRRVSVKAIDWYTRILEEYEQL